MTQTKRLKTEFTNNIMYNIYENNYLGVNKMNTGLPLRKHVPDNENGI